MDAKQFGQERRRRKDRRTSTRAGKLERRKNTCDHCQFYRPQSDIAGLCQKHQTLIKGSDFACVWFKPMNT